LTGMINGTACQIISPWNDRPTTCDRKGTIKSNYRIMA
jgi:hypothetical protein